MSAKLVLMKLANQFFSFYSLLLSTVQIRCPVTLIRVCTYLVLLSLDYSHFWIFNPALCC